MGDTAAGLGLAIIALVASCSPISPTESNGGGPRDGVLIAIPTAPPVMPDENGAIPCHLALLSGRLVAHREWGIAVEGGLVFWPNGYVGRIVGDRIELLDDQGRIIGRTGDRIEAAGGQVTINGLEGFAVCPVGIRVQPAEPL